jgi:predicted RNA-binding protein with PUA-like domain
MARWLLKSEPGSWSWQQQVEAGAKGTSWSGVRNHSAKQNLMAMKIGDEAFFYHSGEGREIVGIVTVIKSYYPDPSDKTGTFGMVDVRAEKPLKTPVGLVAIKAEARLKDMVLVHNPRLSVQPVTDAEWKLICKMGGV